MGDDHGLMPLGRTGLAISRVGIGTWAIGGGNWPYGWGDQDDAESIAAIHRAVELGATWIDTAAVYGLGHAETIVGRAIKDLDKRPYIFTKTGRVADGAGGITGSLKRDSVMREVEQSLARLGVEAIDVYQLHWPDPAEEIDEGWTTCVDLKRQGMVRHIGVCNFNIEQLERISKIAEPETLQPPYSLLQREAEHQLLPFARDHEIGVIVYSPMGSGLLTGAMTRQRIESLPPNDWRSSDSAFRDPELSRSLEIAAKLQKIAARVGTAPAALAVAWTLANPAVSGAIAGFRRPDQVTPVMTAATLHLSRELAAEISGLDEQNADHSAP
ncbi:MAG TPA: aldo/keto reductase [Streptosporangiaceae bacterium]|nr:aldo/keto reductase [Streptosporangiaceae bacterium]